MFRILFLFHRKLLGQLAGCAWKAIQQYFEASASKDVLPAGILSIQTAGDFLNWNPHIHALIACAVFHPDGSFQPVPLLQSNIIQELFEANVFRLLVKEELIGKDLHLGNELPCPNCGKPVKLNAFTINADWRPIAEAWGNKV